MSDPDSLPETDEPSGRAVDEAPETAAGAASAPDTQAEPSDDVPDPYPAI